MNRTMIKKALRAGAGGAEFINQNQVKKTMGWGNSRTQSTLAGLDCIRMQRNKQYLIDEVADRIFAQMETGYTGENEWT